MSSDLRIGGDICSPHDRIPGMDGRRTINGIVIDGGGIMPASRSFFGSFKWCPHSISADDELDAFTEVGDDEDDDDESSCAKHTSEGRKTINTFGKWQGDGLFG